MATGKGRLTPQVDCGDGPLRGSLIRAFALPPRLARFLELLPDRRVLERLVVLCERLFRLALLHEHIAQRFQRIGPVRPAPGSRP